MEIKTEVSNAFTVAQAIRLVIEALNKLIDIQKKTYKKINASEIYKFHLLIAKKDGSKKTDLPSIYIIFFFAFFMNFE